MPDAPIGILGGTFDPIHFGHLRTALDVMQAVGLGEVRFIPLHQAVHRAQPRVGGELRLRMLQAALAGQSGFLADARELRRGGASFMVDTLASLRVEFPARPLCLLLGADAFAHFLAWRKPLEILQLAHLVVMQRPAETARWEPQLERLVATHKAETPAPLQQDPAGHIYFQPVTQLEISSTRIRDLIRTGQSPRFLLPEATLELIQAEGLYRE